MFFGDLVTLFKKILFFLLSFLLAVESQGFSFYLLNSAYADEYDKQREECLKKKSKVWDPALNRCITTKESFGDRQSFRACEQIKDDYAKQRKCFDENAKSMVGDLEPKKAGLAEMQKTAEALGYIQMIIEMIAKEGANNKCMSSKVMAISGIVGMGVDIYLTFFVDDELYNLQDKYAKDITKKKQIEKGTYEAQIEAFDYLQKEQETLISVDEKKIIAYGLMTGLNGVAMLLAIYEMTPFGAAGACTGEGSGGQSAEIEGQDKMSDIGKEPEVGGTEGKGAPDAEPSGGSSKSKSESPTPTSEPSSASSKGGGGGSEVTSSSKGGGGEAPTSSEGGGGEAPTSSKGGGGEASTSSKGGGETSSGSTGVKDKIKGAAETAKQKVLDAVKDVPIKDKSPRGKGGFKDVAGDVKTKQKVVESFDAPDVGPSPKSPGEPPKMTKTDPGPPPSPPKKPAILDNPPMEIPPPPQKPKDPGYLTMSYSDPPELPPSKVKEFNQYGDFPNGGKPPALPEEPPLPPRGAGDPGPPPPKYKGGGTATSMEAPVPPKKPEVPEGVKVGADGDWVKANIDAVSTPKKDITKMTDVDIDNMDVNARDKQKMKDLRAKKEADLQNIKTQEKKYGKDFAGRDKLEKDIAGYDRQSYSIQDSSQRNSVGRQRKAVEGYKADMKKYDLDMETYNKKQAEFENFQKQGGAEINPDYQKWEAKNKKFEDRKVAVEKFNEDYKKWEGKAEQYRQDAKKYRADVEEFKQKVPENKRAELDAYTADLDSHNKQINKLDKELHDFDGKWSEYENKMDQYKTDKMEWKKNYGDKAGADPVKKMEFDNAQKKYDSDMAKYEADYDTWSQNKKEYELEKTNYKQKKNDYDAEVSKYNEDLAEWKSKKERAEITPTLSKKDPGPAPDYPKTPDILENPPGDVPPPPKKPIDPGYVTLDIPETPSLSSKAIKEFPDFPGGGKPPKLPDEPPIPPRGAADPGPPPPKNSPDYNKWAQKNEKFEARKKAVEQFNQDYKKWDVEADKYRSDVKKHRAEVETYRNSLPPDKRAAVDAYAADLDSYNAKIDKVDKKLKDFDNKWIDYENQMDKYKTEKYDWQKKYGDKVGGGDPVKKSQFEAASKKYEKDINSYESQYEGWSQKKSEFDGEYSAAKKKAELDRVNKKFGGAEEEVGGITPEGKKSSLDQGIGEGAPEAPAEGPEAKPKKNFKDAASEVGKEKKVLNAFEGGEGSKVKGEPELPTETPDTESKKITKEGEEPESTAEVTKEPSATEEKPKVTEPEKPKSGWVKFTEGAKSVWNWIKGIPFRKSAQLGTKVVRIKTQFYKDGKPVDYCDPEKEKDCKEKKIEIMDTPKSTTPTQQENRNESKPIEPRSNNGLKKINFSDPNEVLTAFINHKFKEERIENIEDALILEKEWKAKVSGDVKSPSLDEYKKMQQSGLFGKNPVMASILHNIFISYRKINLADSLFPTAKAEDPSSSSTGSVSSKPKNTWDEETDDDEDAANKKKRDEEKGKNAGIMLGSAAAGMIAGKLIEKGLEKFTPMLGKLGKIVDKVRVFFGTSPGIAILSGMSTLINGLTLGFVVEEKKAFGENVDKIKDIKSKFEEDMAESCPAKADRENQAKPQCYCYVSGSQRNPLRKRSDICKSYWSRFDGSFFVGAGEYEFKGEAAIKGCVGIKGNYDINCSCRKFKDRATGGNACMKVNNSFDGIGAIGNSNSVGVLTNYGNDVASDPATIHRLDGDAVGRNAVKMKKASDQALLAFNKTQVANGFKPLTVGPKELENFTNKILSMPESRGAMMAVQEAKTPPARPPLALPKDLKLKEEKKMDLSKITYDSVQKKKVEKKDEAKAKGPDWDFLGGEEKKEKEDMTFMDKGFDYDKGVKKKEIVEKEDTNLFQIISNRYINTGLKLLFQESK